MESLCVHFLGVRPASSVKNCHVMMAVSRLVGEPCFYRSESPRSSGKDDSFDDNKVSTVTVANFVEPKQDVNNTIEKALSLSEKYSR